MHRLTLAVLVAIAAAPAQQPTPTFRASVRLVVQPVTVKDKSGKPIEGLTAKDFVITEDGQPQQIAFVEYQPLDGAPAAAPPAPASSTVAAPTQEAIAIPLPGDSRFRGRRLLVLYLDLYRMTDAEKARVFDAADRYVRSSMAPADLVAIVVFQGRGVRLLQDFTDDRAGLASTIKALIAEADENAGPFHVEWDPGGAFGEDDDTFNLFAADRQLAALQSAIGDLRSLPELKTLIYFGAGLRMNGTDNLAQLRATVNAAIRANVTLNPIDARGLDATPPLGDATRPSPGGVGMFSGTIAQAATTGFQRSQDVLYALAKDTGGKALLDSNDLSRGIVQAAQAVGGYYLIGYYASNTAADGRYRRLKVTLTRDLTADLAYRTGYFGDKVFAKFTTADKERQLADALRLEDPITEIPMALEVNYFQIDSAEYFVPVSVRMAGSELTQSVEIDMIGELKDEHGVTHRNVRDKIRIPPTGRGIQYETAFTVLPGTYVLKMLARNARTGRIGTFERSFVVPNLERERQRLAISSVVLTTQRVNPSAALYSVKQKIDPWKANPLVHEGWKLIPSVTRTFAAGQTLYVFLEAYQHGPIGPLAAYVTFYRSGAKVFETEPLAVVRVTTSPRLPISFTIPLAALAPGAYDCQVTVLDPARQLAAFWRAPIAVTPPGPKK
jgi:VWFA-related protein